MNEMSKLRQMNGDLNGDSAGRQMAKTSGDEYVTIIASTLGAVMEQFRQRELGAKGFSIVGPAARQQFAFAGDNTRTHNQPEHLFGGEAMVGATFKRSDGAQ